MGVGENADTVHTNQGAGNLPARTFVAPLQDRVNRHCRLDGSPITCIFLTRARHSGWLFQPAPSEEKQRFPLTAIVQRGYLFFLFRLNFFTQNKITQTDCQNGNDHRPSF
jgi:hypothetical protein